MEGAPTLFHRAQVPALVGGSPVEKSGQGYPATTYSQEDVFIRAASRSASCGFHTAWVASHDLTWSPWDCHPLHRPSRSSRQRERLAIHPKISK